MVQSPVVDAKEIPPAFPAYCTGLENRRVRGFGIFLLLA